jgi:hypothetical protein
MICCPYCCFCDHALQLGHAYDAQNREVPLGGQDKQDAVKSAKTALELYKTIGWVYCTVLPVYLTTTCYTSLCSGSVLGRLLLCDNTLPGRS